MPVDMYVGGAEHAVLHLLYARFWHKVLYDCGVVSHPEPFQKLVNQGMILGEMEYTAYRNAAGEFVSAEQVDDNGMDKRTGEKLMPVKMADADLQKQGDGFVLKKQADIRVVARAHKMSKSRGNVINPDDIVKEYGADALRLYEMFMGPLTQVKPWSMKGVEGVARFLNRVYRLVVDEETRALSAKLSDAEPVSYTHLDVYKRQVQAYARVQCAASDGLGFVRLAGGTVCHQDGESSARNHG